MTRDRIDCPLIPVPTCEDIDRHTDEIYEREIARRLDDEIQAERERAK